MPTAYYQHRIYMWAGRKCNLHSVHLVHFWSPQVTASRWVIWGPNDLVLARLETFECGCPRDLDILICGCSQVVEAINIDNVWVTAERSLQRVGEVGCMEPSGQARGR